MTIDPITATPSAGPSEAPATDRRCLFCHRRLTAEIQADEHIFPLWLQGYLDIEDEPLEQIHSHPTQGDRVVRTLRYGNFVEGRICGGRRPYCNSGWMNDLECAARPALKPLIQSDLYLDELSDDDRFAVARWAAKTAYMLLTSLPHRPDAPPSHLQALYQLPDQLPPGVTVFGAQHQPDRDVGYWASSSWAIDTNRPRSEVEALTNGSYRVAMQFRHLILIVSYWPDRDWQLCGEQPIHMPIWPPAEPFLVQPAQGIPLSSSGEAVEYAKLSLGLLDEELITSRPSFQAWQPSPVDIPTVRQRAEAAADRADHELAYRLYAHITRHSEHEWEQINAAQAGAEAVSASRRDQQRIKAFEQLLDGLSRHVAQAGLALGSVRAVTGDLVGMKDGFQRARDGGDDELQAIADMTEGLLLERHNERELAEHRFNRAHQTPLFRDQALLALGRCRYVAHDWQAALTHLDNYLASGGTAGSMQADVLRAVCLINLGRETEGRAILNQVNPQADPLGRADLAHAMALFGDPDAEEATVREHLQAAIQTGDVDTIAAAQALLGLTLLRAGSASPRIRRKLDAALATPSAHARAKARLGLGQLALRDGDLDDAFAQFLAARALDDFDATAPSHLGEALVRRRRGESRLAYRASQAAEHAGHPHVSPQAALQSARWLRDDGQLQEAMHAANRALAFNHPVWSPDAVFLIADLAGARIDPAKTVSALQPIYHAGGPPSEPAAFILGTLAEEAGDLAHAGELLGHAHRSQDRTTRTNAAYALGVLHARNGRIQAAVVLLREAAEDGSPTLATQAAEWIAALTGGQAQT